jgi:hypothetical protein
MAPVIVEVGGRKTGIDGIDLDGALTRPVGRQRADRTTRLQSHIARHRNKLVDTAGLRKRSAPAYVSVLRSDGRAAVELPAHPRGVDYWPKALTPFGVPSPVGPS